MKKLLLMLVLLSSMFLFASCNKNVEKVTIILTDGREIRLELYPDIAPQSVANFLKLVDEKHYDGVIFHRVIEGFMIQTGSYYINNGRPVQKPSVPSIFGEFASNGFNNPLKHKAGVISMARTNVYNSGSDQFFICSDTTPSLDGEYAAFGKVRDRKSLKVVKEISKVETREYSSELADLPQKMITIKTIIRG